MSSRRTEQGLTDFHSEIDQAVALAMDYVKEVLEDEKASPRLRFDVAKLVLDRTGARPPRLIYLINLSAPNIRFPPTVSPERYPRTSTLSLTGFENPPWLEHRATIGEEVEGFFLSDHMGSAARMILRI